MNTSRRLRTSLAGLVAASLASAVLLPAAPAAAAPPHVTTITGRVAIDGKGGQTNNGGFQPVLSPNGRYLAFFDLGTEQTWVEDLFTARETMVSVTPSGAPGNSYSKPVGISADGTRIAFTSESTNLAAAPHTAHDLYVRDLVADTTVRVNIGPGGGLVAVDDGEAGLSAAGTEVSWTGADHHAYHRKLTTGTSQRVDVSSTEVGGNDTVIDSNITPDGTQVVFTSYSSNLIASDTNPYSDVFVRNVVAGTTAKVSYGNGGTQPNVNMNGTSASTDGRYVVFVSPAAMTPTDQNPNSDVYLRDTVAGTTTLVSVVGASSPINHHAANPVISADGKHVLFQTAASNIFPGDATGNTNLFRRDLATQFTTTIDQSSGLKLSNGNLNSTTSLSADGSVVAFASDATNLVEGDTNGRVDAFVRMPVSMGPHLSFSQLASTAIPRFGGSLVDGGPAAADLLNGRSFPGRLVADLAHEPTWAQHREPITRLYGAFFERQPDLGGLTYWVNRRKGGTTLNTIATKFAQSSEFEATYGATSPSAFVTLVYQHVLDRNPDQAGLDHWVAKLGGGMTRGAVMVQFSESNEGKRHLAPSVDATLIGLGLLGTMPTTADHQAAVAADVALGGPEGAARWFLDSAAYAATV